MNQEQNNPLTPQTVEWDDPRAVALRSAMDVEMGIRYAAPEGVPRSAEAMAKVQAALFVDPADVPATVLVVDQAGRAVAHAALRRLRGEWEVKRVIVDSSQRGKGVGRTLMLELEAIARRGGATRLILQTGDRQPEAVALYEKLGYTPIPTYEPYIEAIPMSLCYEKAL